MIINNLYYLALLYPKRVEGIECDTIQISYNKFYEEIWSIFISEQYFLKPKFLWCDNITAMVNGLRWEIIVRYVGDGGIVDHHCLHFLFIMLFDKIIQMLQVKFQQVIHFLMPNAGGN
jgi:hypothetical protein